ncbi:MAG: phosphotriesterase [bacterium]|nr:phosphotriesterase [bacterium]MDE0290651.1 phosphotriesterase [bacterium]MDE0439104.1 phosphotriesterase [bacterium]
MPINTVLGPIDPRDLGPTTMHEHLLINAVEALDDPDTETVDRPITIDQLGDLRWNAVSNRFNLSLDDPEITVAELRRFHAAGGRGLVDVTPIGIGRRVAELPAISERSGVHIMLGCGFYRGPSHPPWIREVSAEDVAAYFIDELDNGLDGTGIRPAIIGEIGTTDPVTENEFKVLQGSAIAAVRTGAAISVHLDPQGQYQAPRILDWLVRHGADPTRVVFGHSDEILDLDNHRGLMDSGATVEYDLFGTEFYYPGRGNYATDYERMEAVALLVSEGYADRLVLAGDVHLKMMLTAYGGMGYAHVMGRIVPFLREEFGLGSRDLNRMLVENPARLLDRP